MPHPEFFFKNHAVETLQVEINCQTNGKKRALIEEVRNAADLATIDNDNDYQQYCQYVCEQEQIAQPKRWKKALTLFQHLLTLES